MHQNSKSGFTLIECLITVSLLGLLYLGALTSFTFFSTMLEKADIEQFFLTALHLQHCAQRTHTNHELVIYPNTNSYSTADKTIHFKSSLQFGAPSVALSKEHAIGTTFKHNTIVFYPSGIISTGTTYLISATSSRMYAISSAVSSVSFLRKYQYAGSWKQYS